jgi:hypothetical protein
MGASLLVFKNKSDVVGCMDEEEIRKVRRLLKDAGPEWWGSGADGVTECRLYDSTPSKHTDGLL